MKAIFLEVDLDVLLNFLSGQLCSLRIVRVTAPGVDLPNFPADTQCFDVMRPEPNRGMRVFLKSEQFPAIPQGGLIPRGEIHYEAAR